MSAASSKRVKRRSVAFQGSSGAFSQDAAKEHFMRVHGEEVNSTGYIDFQAVFSAVEDGAAEYGIVPIENSASGTLHSIYDLLLNGSLHVVGECSAVEELCLCALPGTAKKDLVKVMSHAAMFQQCSQFLAKLDGDNGRRTVPEALWDTAGACALIKEGGVKDAAAIASREAAGQHQLEILEAGIGNDKNNETRYLLLAKDPVELPDSAWHSRIRLKSSVAIALQNVPNALFKMVSCFALRNLSIIKLESRPASTAGETVFRASGAAATSPKRTVKHWDYIFYVDYEPSFDAEVNNNMLRSLQEFCVAVRSFGTYRQNLPDVVAVQSPWSGQLAALGVGSS
eukprot:g3438.t1